MRLDFNCLKRFLKILSLAHKELMDKKEFANDIHILISSLEIMQGQNANIFQIQHEN